MKEGWEKKKLGDVVECPNLRITRDDMLPNKYVGVENLVKDRGGMILSSCLPDIQNAIELQ